MRTIIAVCVLLLWMPFTAYSEDWPKWRGPRADGTWNGPNIKTQWGTDDLPEVWSQPIGGGYAGVTVADDRVYVMGRTTEPETEIVFCFNAQDGKKIWSHTYDAPYADLTYNNGPRASVTVHDGHVYTLGAVGHAFCLNAETGEVVWSIDAMGQLGSERPKWGFAGSPVIVDDNVVLHIGAKPGGCLVAVNRKTGREAWRAGDDPAGYATPIMINHQGRRQLVCWNPINVISVDAATGKQLWTVHFPIQYGVAIATPIFHDGLLLVPSYWHGSKAIRLGDKPTEVTIGWEDKAIAGLMSQALYRNGYAYMLDAKRGIRCFEYKTGKHIWEDEQPRVTRRGRHPQASLVWLNTRPDDDLALILNSEGELVLARLSPRGYKELARKKIIGETWAHAAFAGERVYARDDKRVVCVRLPILKSRE